MKYQKSITFLTLLIIVFSLFASLYGIFSTGGPGEHTFQSLHGNIVDIYGNGLYKNESVSMATQAKAQDLVTLILGIPLIIISLIMYRKKLLKGKLLLTGTIGYFLYTYTSYTFLSMMNSMFLVYIVLMSSSLFSFILIMMSYDVEKIDLYFNKMKSYSFISIFLFLLAFILLFLWIGMIIPSILSSTVPKALEHYSTLVIQAMDLGIVVPASILSAILLIRRKPFGYLLSTIIIIKGLTLGTALTAMIIGQVLAGIQISPFVIIIFPVLNIFIIYCLYILMKSINESANIVK